MKLKVLALCIIVVCALLALAVDAQAMSKEAALKYMTEHPDEAADDIMRLDAMEHAEPLISQPKAAIALTDKDASVSWSSPLVLTVGAYSWKATISTIVFKDVVPQTKSFKDGLILGGVIGILAGAGLEAVIRR